MNQVRYTLLSEVTAPVVTIHPCDLGSITKACMREGHVVIKSDRCVFSRNSHTKANIGINNFDLYKLL